MLRPKFAFITTAILILLSLQPSLCQQPLLTETAGLELSAAGTSSPYRQTLFPISSATEIWGFVLVIFLGGLCNSGGLAGRPILLAVLIMVFNYSQTFAIQIVFSLVFGASLGNFINVVGRRDPVTKKPLIEYNIVLACMPTMLLGASFGIILDRMACQLINTIGIMALTVFSLSKLYIKARKAYKEENEQRKETLSMNEDTSLDTSVSSYLISSVSESNEVETSDPRLSAYYQDERQIFPKKKIAMLVTLIGLIMMIDLSKGTKKFKSIVGAEYCTPVYWGIICMLLVVCFTMLFLNRRLLKPSLELKKIHNIITTKNRFELANGHMNKLSMLSLMAGVFAGFLGIGGGMSPVLLNLGVPPASIGATSGFLIMQTSFVSLFQALLFEDIPIQDQGFFLLISVVGSFGVSSFLRWLVKKYKRPSILIYTLVVVLSLFLVTIPVFEIVTNIGNFGQLLQFNPPC